MISGVQTASARCRDKQSLNVSGEVRSGCEPGFKSPLFSQYTQNEKSHNSTLKEKNAPMAHLEETAEVLERAIPRGLSKQVAFDAGVCPRLVQKWRSAEEHSPLSRFAGFFRALYLNTPIGAAEVFAYIESLYRALQKTHSSPMADIQRLSILHKETTEAVQAMIEGRSIAERRKELVEARDAIDRELIFLEELDRDRIQLLRKVQ